MLPLNRQNLFSGAFHVPHSPAPLSKPLRVLQIGEGNFLRAYFDWMLDVANGAGLINVAVTVIPPRARGGTPQLNAQEGLYTVLMRGVAGGVEINERRVVSCLHEGLDPHTQWDALLDFARDPHWRFVASNTTEAGICYVAEPLLRESCPQSFPAKLAALMWARFQALGEANAPGLVVIPCELIEANGSTLQRFVLQHAKAWRLPSAFIEWLSRANHFCNTLVDRIVPGFPRAEADDLFAEFGYTDPLLVAAEPFHLMVIEAPADIAAELPLDRAGLNVLWTDDLAPHRQRKVRFLNGAHSASALAAFCAGINSVYEMTQDALFAHYLQRLLFDEIAPFVPGSDAERRAYAQTVLDRFANAHIHHELISISLNSVSKWQVRVLPSIKDYCARHGRAPALLAFSLAALLYFYRGRYNAKGECWGDRGTGHVDAKLAPYLIRDNPEVLSMLAEAWRLYEEGAERDSALFVARILSNVRLWGENLAELPGMTSQVSAGLNAIQAHGMRTAVSQLIAAKLRQDSV